MESKICGFKRSKYERLKDKIGALKKATQLKRLEEYSDIIGDVLAKYNTDDDKRTMMFKLIRHPEPGTTTRRKHTENVTEIAGEIADNFDWLNSNITRIMAKEHDTGHSFEGHSGEWWVSCINEEYGMPNYVHNATGARKLVYKENVYDEIISRIKQANLEISPKKLKQIRSSLWLIIDGINCHNGEKSEHIYEPDFSKNEKRFKEEVMGCYAKKEFDRTLVPATAEGSLMRLCDKISYIPFDLVDIFRNKCDIATGEVNGETIEFEKEYEQKFREMGLPENTFSMLLSAQTEEEYDSIAKLMQTYFVNDVIKHTTRNHIEMSPEMSKVMHGIRDLNNKMMVNYTVMKEDHEAYVPAIEKLISYYAKFLTFNHLVDKNDVEQSSITKFHLDKSLSDNLKMSVEYEPLLSGFAEYISNINEADFKFSIEACKRSLEVAVDGELNIAENIALGKLSRGTITPKGLKGDRIRTYANSFKESLDVAYSKQILHSTSISPYRDFRRDTWMSITRKRIKQEALSGHMGLENTTGTIPLSEMVARDIASQYLLNLNDEQFFELVKMGGFITPEQEKSLQRKYNEFDFRAEHQKHTTWEDISKLQNLEEASGDDEKISRGKKPRRGILDFLTR